MKDFTILQNQKNDGTEEIGLATPPLNKLLNRDTPKTEKDHDANCFVSGDAITNHNGKPRCHQSR